jgi:branched-chain amino acid transport system permease protein
MAPPPAFERVETGPYLLRPRVFMNALGAICFAFAFLLPFITINAYVISIATSAVIYIMLASGLNIVVGYAGLLDLGYVAFFAVGAYTWGIMSTRLHWGMIESIPVVLAICVVAGIVIGGPTLRLRSDYLAIVTLGFGEIIRITANNIQVTGGPQGIYGIPKFSFLGLDLSVPITIGGIVFQPAVSYYMFCVFCMAVAVLLAARLAKGRMGRAWKAVRDDEDAAEAMGINTYATKLTAYITGAVWGGMAGVLMGSHLGSVAPGSFVFLQSALVLMAVVLGGMGSTPGIVIGALVISLGPELLRGFGNGRYFLFGVLLIVCMLFRPQGVWPSTWRLPFLRSARVERVDILDDSAGNLLDRTDLTPQAGDDTSAEPQGGGR